jgi:DnaJ-domain-containing protein 1
MLRRGGWRLVAGLFSLVLIVVGAVITIKGEWWAGLPMAMMGLLSAFGARTQPGARPAGRGPAKPEAMSAADARSLLGVEPDATPAEIKAAYTRLMQRAHPDKGGTAGLAAQLNAARDRLLKA